jgi:hypothetical protein
MGLIPHRCDRNGLPLSCPLRCQLFTSVSLGPGAFGNSTHLVISRIPDSLRPYYMESSTPSNGAAHTKAPPLLGYKILNGEQCYFDLFFCFLS